MSNNHYYERRNFKHNRRNYHNYNNNDYYESNRDTRWEKLENRIKNLAEEDGFELESDLPRLARAIQAAFEYYEDVIPQTIYKFLTQQPHKVQHYSALILLLSLSTSNDSNEGANVGQKVLDHCLIKWKEGLESRKWIEIRIGTNFFSNLVPLLISPDSYFETLETFTKVLEEPGVSQVRAERSIECLLESMIYGSKFLSTQPSERYTHIVDIIDYYIRHNEDESSNYNAILYPWVNVPQSLNYLKEENNHDQLKISIDVIKNLFDDKFNSYDKFPLIDIEEHFPSIKEVDPALRTELPNVLIPPEHSFENKVDLKDMSKFTLQILEDDSIPSPSSFDGIILYSVLKDMINLYHRNRIDCAKILMDLPTFFPSKFFNNNNNNNNNNNVDESYYRYYSLENCLVSTILSEMFSLPQSKHPNLYYSSLITELCKLSPKTIAPALGKCLRKLYNLLGDGLDTEILIRLSEWFATHLSNFGFNWVWKEWLPDLDLPKSHPKLSFIRRVTEIEIRLSYYDRIAQSLPEELVSNENIVVQPKISYIYGNEEHPYHGYANTLIDMIKTKSGVDDLMEQTIKIEEELKENVTLPQNGINATKVSRDLLVQSLLYMGSRSFSHFLNMTERYLQLLRNITSTQNDRIDLLRSLGRFLRFNTQNKKIYIDKLLQYRLIEPTDVIVWLFESNDKDFPNDVLPSEDNNEIDYSDIAFAELLKTTLDKVNSRVLQTGQRLAMLKSENENQVAIERAKNTDMDINDEDNSVNEKNTNDNNLGIINAQNNYETVRRDQRECFVILIQYFVSKLGNCDGLSDNLSEYDNDTWNKWFLWSYYRQFIRHYFLNVNESIETIQAVAFENVNEEDARYKLWKSNLTLNQRCN